VSPVAHVALLRGINVGGKRILPMKSLAAIFSDAGCRNVETYIQSGNVVFHAGPALARRVPAVIAAGISRRFGFDVPVIARTADDLRRAVRDNPFLRAGAEIEKLHVVFLADRPAAARVARLDPDRSPTDRFEPRGREIYLHCPHGLGRSRLTNDYFDRTLATIGTVRNWKTVLRLLEMTAGR
jgi:uncharacterized protein (DUF1697 family)